MLPSFILGARSIRCRPIACTRRLFFNLINQPKLGCIMNTLGAFFGFSLGTKREKCHFYRSKGHISSQRGSLVYIHFKQSRNLISSSPLDSTLSPSEADVSCQRHTTVVVGGWVNLNDCSFSIVYNSHPVECLTTSSGFPKQTENGGVRRCSTCASPPALCVGPALITRATFYKISGLCRPRLGHQAKSSDLTSRV